MATLVIFRLLKGEKNPPDATRVELHVFSLLCFIFWNYQQHGAPKRGEIQTLIFFVVIFYCMK